MTQTSSASEFQWKKVKRTSVLQFAIACLLMHITLLSQILNKREIKKLDPTKCSERYFLLYLS